MIFGSVRRVAGMLQSVSDDAWTLIAGVFGLVVALEVGSFSTVEVGLLGVGVSFALKRLHIYSTTDRKRLGSSSRPIKHIPVRDDIVAEN